MSESLLSTKDETVGKKFDFNKYPRRRIAIQFAYLGWNYDGLVKQPDNTQTVEEALYQALLRLKLIESWEVCCYNRSGRTDKGVSAYRQIASLLVRTDDTEGEHVFWDDETRKAKSVSPPKMNYVNMLNAVLPKDIRVLAWAPMSKDFNARYDCTKRTYKYFFPIADFDLAAMRAACDYLIGEHDLRNFCKIDNNMNRVEKTYVRTIYSASIVTQKEKNEPSDMAELKISASGFLWHQIRYIMSLLYEVGQGNEKPEIIQELLDVQKIPSKPVYDLAEPTGLFFYDCAYDNVELNWRWEKQTLLEVKHLLLREYLELQMRSNVVKSIVDGLNVSFLNEVDDGNVISKAVLIPHLRHSKRKKYIPISKRPRCESLEVRREKLITKKRKLFTSDS